MVSLGCSGVIGIMLERRSLDVETGDGIYVGCPCGITIRARQYYNIIGVLTTSLQINQSGKRVDSQHSR